MNSYDDIFTPDEVILKGEEVEQAEILPPFECDCSMSIELRAVKPEDEKDLMCSIEYFCNKMVNKFSLIKKDKIFYFKFGFKKYPLLWHHLIRCFCQYIKIKGDSDSFAIIKFYRGNCTLGEATFIYEDYVTPYSTLDVNKLATFVYTLPVLFKCEETNN